MGTNTFDRNEWWITGFRRRWGQRVHRSKRSVIAWWKKKGDIGQPGVQQVITIGAGIITGTAAMVTFLQQAGTTKRDFLMYIYLPAVLAPIAFLGIVTLLRVRGDGGSRFYFDWPTRLCGAIVGVAACIAVFLVVSNGLAGTLPGQPPAGPLKLTSVYPRPTKAGDSRIVVSIDMGSEVFPDGLPDYLFLTLELKAPIIDRWTIDRVVLFKGKRGSPMAEDERIRPGDGASQYLPLPFVRPLDKDAIYRVDITLSDKKDQPLAVTEDVNLIKDGIGVEVRNKSDL